MASSPGRPTAADHRDIETGVVGGLPTPPQKSPSAQGPNRPLQLMAREWVQWRLVLFLLVAPLIALLILVALNLAVGGTLNRAALNAPIPVAR